MNLPIRKYPDLILRQPGEKINFPLKPEIIKLIRNMFDTVRAANGIGLAAPQVGKSLRLIVVNLEHMGVPAFPIINPEIVKFSRQKSSMEEGCLSIPGVFGQVERPETITFTGYNTDGQKIKIKASQLLAKVIQHEIDHINGILIIDKITKYTKGAELIKIHQENSRDIKL